MKMPRFNTFGCVLASSLLLSSIFANADTPLERYSSGSGCPAGSTSVTTTPDGSTVTLLFDQFVAQAGGALSTLSDMKNCQMVIPISVPDGYTLGVYKIDYRGFALLPPQSYAMIRVDYALAGMRSPQFHRRFTGTRNQGYTITDTIGAGAFRWLPCGGDRTILLNLDASLQLQLRAQSGPLPQALVSLDSADGSPKGGIIYHFKTKQCH